MKTITATVRVTLYPACSPLMAVSSDGSDAQGELAGPCGISAQVVTDFTDQVNAIWNNGLMYHCYLVVVNVDVTVDQTGTRSGTPGDRLMVAVDQTPVNVRGHVHSAPAQPGWTWNGNTTQDVFVPVNSADQPTTVAWPATIGPGQPLYTFAHDVGHMLGLDDSYEYVPDANGNSVRQLRAGAVDDLMAGSQNTTVDPSTVDRLVERTGALPPDEVKCDYKIDQMIDWWHISSLKCGGPTGQWDLHVDGVRDLGGASLALTGEGAVTLSRGPTSFTGPWGAQYAIDLVGVPHAIGGQDGTVLGNGELAAGALALLATAAQGSFFAQTPAASLSGAAGNPAKDLLLQVTNGSFC
jgi:hypothetical protein